MRSGSSRRRPSREVLKYIAISYKLLAEVAMARGDLADAEVKLAAGLDLLHRFPAPLVVWKTYAVLGRLRRLMGDRGIGARDLRPGRRRRRRDRREHPG